MREQILGYLVPGEFITVFIGWWNKADRLFSYAGAGHPPALLLSPDRGVVERLHVSEGVLGIKLDYGISNNVVTLRRGQRLVLYTDGITEATNLRQEIFGEGRLAECCLRSKNQSVAQLVDEVFASVDEFAAGAPQADDQAMMALESMA